MVLQFSNSDSQISILWLTKIVGYHFRNYGSPNSKFRFRFGLDIGFIRFSVRFCTALECITISMVKLVTEKKKLLGIWFNFKVV